MIDSSTHVRHAGAIYVDSGSTLTAKNMRVTGNEASLGAGGGIFCGNDASTNLVKVNFTSNNARHGGGLALIGSREASIEKCQFHDNKGIAGGGIASLFVTTAVDVDECTFHNNLAGAKFPQQRGMCMISQGGLMMEA